MRNHSADALEVNARRFIRRNDFQVVGERLNHAQGLTEIVYEVVEGCGIDVRKLIAPQVGTTERGFPVCKAKM